MENETKSVVTIYAESTPNPASLKFVASMMLLNEGVYEYKSADEAENSPLAKQLFNFD